MSSQRRKKTEGMNKVNKNDKSDSKLDAEAKELIRQAMTAALQEKLASEKGIKKDLHSLTTVVEEFLKSFIILGYTFDGTPIHCVSAHNQQEADSLITLINKYFQLHLSENDPE